MAMWWIKVAPCWECDSCRLFNRRHLWTWASPPVFSSHISLWLLILHLWTHSWFLHPLHSHLFLWTSSSTLNRFNWHHRHCDSTLRHQCDHQPLSILCIKNPVKSRKEQGSRRAWLGWLNLHQEISSCLYLYRHHHHHHHQRHHHPHIAINSVPQHCLGVRPAGAWLSAIQPTAFICSSSRITSQDVFYHDRDDDDDDDDDGDAAESDLFSSWPWCSKQHSHHIHQSKSTHHHYHQDFEVGKRNTHSFTTPDIIPVVSPVLGREG